MASTSTPTHLPTIDPHLRQEAGRELQATLVDLVDLTLVGKQLHWSVVGPAFRTHSPSARRARRCLAGARRHGRRARRHHRHVPRRPGRCGCCAQQCATARGRRDRGSRGRARAGAPHRRDQRAGAGAHGPPRRPRRRLAGRPRRGRARARGAAVDGASPAAARRCVIAALHPGEVGHLVDTVPRGGR